MCVRISVNKLTEAIIGGLVSVAMSAGPGTFVRLHRTELTATISSLRR